MKFTKEQLTKAKSAKSVEELLALAKENGIELTEEEAAKYYAEWHKEGELSDDELDNVAGGGCGGDDYSGAPKKGWTICAEHPEEFPYTNVGFFKCPKCGELTDFHSADGYDLCKCNICGKKYRHYWNGDIWCGDKW